MSVATLAAKPRPDDAGYLRDDENPFSTNKVTGHSLNFPIIGTCRPTEVCADTCYFARGPATWPASLAKQARLLNSTRDRPLDTAAAIAAWAARLRLTFVRWNGGGDLFPESVECLNRAAAIMPATPQWVVTRKPEVAALVAPRPNVYVHFSVDRASWQRLADMLTLAPTGLRWFWSYQCDRGETPEEGIAPVVFRDCYDLADSAPILDDCPLNLASSIVGVCESCRRCFNGAALERAKDCLAKVRSSPRLFGKPNNAAGG